MQSKLPFAPSGYSASCSAATSSCYPPGEASKSDQRPSARSTASAARTWSCRADTSSGSGGSSASGPQAKRPSPLDAALRRIFGHPGFRPRQREVVEAVLADVDCFVLLPTGGGKSLCYQLPAVLSRGVTVVISPLLALIQDQVCALVRSDQGSPECHGVPATYLSSAAPAGHTARVLSDLGREPPTTKLLYVTPEMIQLSQALRSALLCLSERKPRQLARIVIDEAHCVSQWGHDFRPDYKTLGELRKLFGGSVPFSALTATATRECEADVRKLLKLHPSCFTSRSSFNRPNLKYSVVRKAASADQAPLAFLPRV